MPKYIYHVEPNYNPPRLLAFVVAEETDTHWIVRAGYDWRISKSQVGWFADQAAAREAHMEALRVRKNRLKAELKKIDGWLADPGQIPLWSPHGRKVQV